MRGPQEFTGLILFNQNYKEKDKLVKIFTETSGKKMFLVKRANQPNNGIKASIQPFTKACFVGKINEDGLSFLNASKQVEPFYNIQKDIFLASYATYILNLTDVSIDDGMSDPLLYGFVLQTLTLIDKGYDAEIMTAIFEVQMMNRFGLQFNWKSCPICGQTSGEFDFSHEYNGILCKEHWHLDSHRYHFHPKSIHFIRLFSEIELKKIKTITLSSESRFLIRQTLDLLYEDYIGIRLKSKQFIQKMDGWKNLMLENRD